MQSCLRADTFYPPNTSKLVDLYEDECSRPGLAPTNAFVLVEWGSIMIQHVAQKGTSDFEKYGLKIIQAHARALELVLSTDVHGRRSVCSSAIINTRRALRKLIRAGGGPAVLSVVKALTVKGHPLGIKAANFLGILAGVCSHLTNGVTLLAACKQDYYAYYLREILGSRNLVPKHLASAFNDFFKRFTTYEDLQKEIIPSLEKTLLRAPEVVLNNLLSPLFESMPEDIDVATILAKNLSPPLFAAVKSSNISVRDGALSAFHVLIGRSRDQQALGTIADELLLPMSTSKMAADHRALYAQVSAMLPALPGKSKAICESLCNIVARETSEIALGSEIATLLRQFPLLLEGDQAVIKAVIRTCIVGLEDKRPGIRRQWLLGLGDLLWDYRGQGVEESFERPHLGKLEADCLPCFLKIAEEVVRNPIPSITTGLVISPLITICICMKILDSGQEAIKAMIQKTKLIDKILSTDVKSATLLNPRIYAKLAEQDSRWQIRALIASSAEVEKLREGDVGSAWSQAMIYSIVSDDHPKLRKLAMDALATKSLNNMADVAQIMIRGLWTWYGNIEADKKDTAAAMAKAGTRRLHFVVNSIIPTLNNTRPRQEASGSTILQAQLVNMLVLCRPEILPQVHWIDLCLNVGEDPGIIASKNAKECLEKVDHFVSPQEMQVSPNVSLAAYNTAAELAFVSPDSIIPLLLNQIIHDLPVDKVSACGPTEVAIARTPSDTAFIDVLSSQNQKYVVDKNSKDYDTMKWEEEMRSQIATKKGQQKKLTADERAKVSAQLAKEAQIRKDVYTLQETLRNRIGYIHALATGPPTEAIMWLGPSLQALTAVIEAGAGRLVGDAADEAYLACSNFVSSRLGVLRRFLGVATLRLLGSALPSYLEQEPLKGLIFDAQIRNVTKSWQISSHVSFIDCTSWGSNDLLMKSPCFTCCL